MKHSSELFPIILAGGLIFLAAKPADAHHAFSAEFDAEQPIELKGVVTKAPAMSKNASTLAGLVICATIRPNPNSSPNNNASRLVFIASA